MIQYIITYKTTGYQSNKRNRGISQAVKHRLDVFLPDKQDNNHYKQHYIFIKRLPRRKRNSIAKTTTIRYFIEISRIKSKERKEHNHQHQQPKCEFTHITQQKHQDRKSTRLNS